MYKPLPKELTIKESSIDGLGLFANEDILINEEFGISHVKDKLFEDNYIRTPLGGFVNHSNNPNCEFYKDGNYIKLRTIKSVSKGNELTAKYWLYDMEELND